MIGQLLSIIAFTLLSSEVNTQRLESPCPRLFVYENSPSPEPDRWYGIVTLLSDIDLNGVWLRLLFDKPSIQLGNWFGEADGREGNKEFLVKNRTAFLKANVPQTVRFYIKYNPNEPPPKLTGFRLNARTMCPEGLEDATTMVMELQTSNQVDNKPTPRPPFGGGGGGAGGGGAGGGSNSDTSSNSVFLSSNNNNNGNRRTTTTARTTRVTTRATTPAPQPPPTAPRPSVPNNGGSGNGGANQIFSKPGGGFNSGSSGSDDDDDDVFPGDYSFVNATQQSHFTGSESDEVCGTTILKKRQNTYNQETVEGEFPWHAAIYRTKGINLVYWCGGTLISKSHVLTVAHCVTKWRTKQPQDADNFVIYLGKYYLNRFTSGVQERLVNEIVPHPNYDPKLLCNDLAMVKLKFPVQITDYVRPACLWRDSTDLDTVVNRQGSIVGWSIDDNGKLSQQLTKANMPVASLDVCTYRLPRFSPLFTTGTTYCANFVQGTSVCNGDSGGGMVFPKEIPSKNKVVWELRGLVSFSVDVNNEFRCDVSHFLVFTDVAKYLPWIQQLLKS